MIILDIIEKLKTILTVVLILTIGVSFIHVLINIGVAVLGYIFNYPLQGFLIALAMTTLLFLLPDRK